MTTDLIFFNFLTLSINYNVPLRLVSIVNFGFLYDSETLCSEIAIISGFILFKQFLSFYI